MNKLRLLISSNFFGAHNERFITFTFAEPVTDTHKLKALWRNFLKRLKRRIDLSKARYIVIFEPQGRLIKKGDEYYACWHIHLLLKGPHYIDIATIRETWGLGIVNVKMMADFKTDNLAAYLTSFATSLNLNKVDTLVKQAIEEQQLPTLLTSNNKRIAKGARLMFYPPYFHFYAVSTNIMTPKTIKMKYKNVDKEKLGRVVSKHSYSIRDQNGNLLNCHQIINFDRKTNKSQEKK